MQGKLLKNRIVPIFLSILILLCLQSYSDAEEIAALRVGYICYDLKGDKRWQATSEIRKVEGTEEGIHTLTEKGSGHYYPFEGKVSWVSNLEFEDFKNRIRPLKLKKRIFDSNKRLIGVEEQNFNFLTNEAAYGYTDMLSNKKKEKIFKFKGDILNRLILPVYIKKILRDGKRNVVAQMLTSEPKLYNMDVRIVGEEVIDINGKSYHTFKICLDPNLGLLNIFKTFIPKSYIWHLTTGNFDFLQYKGLESSPSSPKVKIVVPEFEKLLLTDF